MIRESWDGGEWQDHCRKLLGMRYGTNIQFIPDRDRGDGGLEAYDFDGNAYQCYAAQEAYNTKALTDAQKAKIATDIAKLSKDLVKTKKLLGEVILLRWTLLTPSFDSKDIVEYARTKSQKVRKDPRPFWCHENFQIVVATDADIFAAERAQLFSQLENKLHLDVPIPDADAVFAAAGGGTADRLAEKLRAERTFAVDEGRLGRYKSSLLGDYVRGQQQMGVMENEYPLIYAAINRRLKSTLLGIDRELMGTAGAGPQLVEQLLQRLAANLQTDAPGLGSLLCEEIARYAVAEWFVDCPLYFPEAA